MTGPTETTRTEEMSFARILIGLARHYLGGRRGLLIFGGITLAAGLMLNWSWAVAIGLAPILIALAPCAIMCALGVCMHKMGNKTDPGKSQTNGIPKADRAAENLRGEDRG